MARIDGEIVIGRPIDAVFDYVSDQSNEPQYNPRMVRAEKITPGSVGEGTRFRSAVPPRLLCAPGLYQVFRIRLAADEGDQENGKSCNRADHDARYGP